MDPRTARPCARSPWPDRTRPSERCRRCDEWAWLAGGKRAGGAWGSATLREPLRMGTPRHLAHAKRFRFSSVLMPKYDPAARQIVRRNLDPDPITRQHANAKAPHVAAERRENRVGVVHRDAKRRVRQHFRDRAFELDGVLLRHVRSDCAPKPRAA